MTDPNPPKGDPTVIEMAEKTDVTQRATAAGWTLPKGFKVLAYLEHDDDLDEPREKGDVYNTDVDEADYDNPTHGFCKFCGEWIHKADQEQADAADQCWNPEGGERVVEVGDWLAGTAGLKCREIMGGHELDDPLVVRWWQQDRWRFVTVVVEVVDENGREWAGTSLGAVEDGDFPVITDPETGAYEVKTLNPITDPHHPLPDMIAEVLGEASEELAKHIAKMPVITPPPGE